MSRTTCHNPSLLAIRTVSLLLSVVGLMLAPCYVYSTVASGGSERWALVSSPFSFAVSSSRTITGFGYYHQFMIGFGYSDQDRSMIPAGALLGDYLQFGSLPGIFAGVSYGVTVPASGWADATTGVQASFVQYVPYTAASGSEQWVTPPGSDLWVVSSAGDLSATYYHQYLVTFAVSPSGSGSTVPTGTNVWGECWFSGRICYTELGVFVLSLVKQYWVNHI